jgi:hypothetical protein
MNNLENWKKVSTPPAWAKKNISDGRMKGMTDINPQWRLMAMTETYGVCGIGWKYTIDRKWLEKGGDEDKLCAFVDVSLFIYDSPRDRWSEAIPGTGGNVYTTKESSGKVHTSDECFKMALTDALSVAMKALGVGADVYCGAKYFPSSVVVDERSIEERIASCQSIVDLAKLWTDIPRDQQPKYLAMKEKRKGELS